MALNFEEFKAKTSKVLNIDLDSYKEKRVKRRINSLMDKSDIEDYDQCLYLIKNNSEFKEEFLSHFTINTSEFFRNPENFKYLQEKVLPRLLNEKKQIKIWSAACSDGSEPYTLAIILNEMNIKADRFQIQATDLDQEILRKAKEGIYNENSVKKVEAKILNKYFTEQEDKYILTPKIKKQINFKQHNLLIDNYGSNWDLILCRNVFIYFTKETKATITQKLSNSLRKHGYLFLGNTEYLLLPDKYNLKKDHTSFYMRQI